ncbi:MAG: hypothetical protein RSF79_18360, partial [Janthinobacterium sp.]
MSTLVNIAGTIVLGQGSLSARLSLPGTSILAELEKNSSIDFRQMIDELMRASFLSLPDNFPQLLLTAASLQYDSQSGDLSFSGTVQMDWHDPLGLTGVTVKDWTLAFKRGASGASLHFQIRLDFGSLRLTGDIWFEQGKLVVVSATIAQPISIDTFLSSAALRVDWGDLIPIEFSGQAPDKPIRLYYAAAPFEGFPTQGFVLDQTQISIMDFSAFVSVAVTTGG